MSAENKMVTLSVLIASMNNLRIDVETAFMSKLPNCEKFNLITACTFDLVEIYTSHVEYKLYGNSLVLNSYCT